MQGGEIDKTHRHGHNEDDTTTTNTRIKTDTYYHAEYNTKDLILYALSIGYGSSSSSSSSSSLVPPSRAGAGIGQRVRTAKEDDNDDEAEERRFAADLCYVYEQDPHFTAVPTFCLVLLFRATMIPPTTTATNSDTDNNHEDHHNGYALPSFPPISMQRTNEFLQKFFIKKTEDDEEEDTTNSHPILHIQQSIIWHETEFPVPANINSTVKVHMHSIIMKVVPRSIGTFVTTQTQLYVRNHKHENGHHNNTSTTSSLLLCTLQSTTLILGLPKENVIPYDYDHYKNNVGHKDDSEVAVSTPPPPTSIISLPRRHDAPDYASTFRISRNQALFYRLTSGDSNHIHVVPDPMLDFILSSSSSSSPDSKSPRPILHGLCTLGISAREIIHYLKTTHTYPNNNNHNQHNQEQNHAGAAGVTKEVALHSLQVQFTKPVFIGDVLHIQIWCHHHKNESSNTSRNTLPTNNNTRTYQQQLSFEVRNKNTNEIVIKNGVVTSSVLFSWTDNHHNNSSHHETLHSKL